MPPKALIIGIPLLLIGFALFGLFGIAGIDIAPFSGTTGSVTPIDNQVASAFTKDILLVGNVPSHPFFVAVNVQFLIDSGFTIDCDVSLYYQSSDGSVYARIPGTQKVIYSEEMTKGVISTQIGPSSAGRGFKLYLSVYNKGLGTVTITQSRVDLQFTLFSHVLPILLILIGGIMSILAYMRGKKAPSKIPKPVATGWEPTLQWGTTSGTTKTKSSSSKSKLSIKSTKAPKTEKKVVKKTVPAGGAQIACKFCGKQVSASAFFCPHCYGKLR